MKCAGTTLDRVSVRISACGILLCRVVDLLSIGRQQITPVATVVGRKGNTALIETDAAVVHSSEQVVRFDRIEGDIGFGLPSERAILVDTLVAMTIAISASKRARRSAQIRKWQIVPRAKISPLLPVFGSINCRACRGQRSTGEERRGSRHDCRTTDSNNLGCP